MKKYSKESINDYILGNDVEGYSIEELENDKDFMMLVIEATNDKRIYDLCSEDVKKNYDFVKYLVNKFKDDINFICNVADYYLSSTEDELTVMELNILMSELTSKDKEKNMKYSLAQEVIYSSKRVEIEAGKLELNDPKVDREIGMGFLLIFDSFNSSEIILNYFAKKTIEEIFNENNIDLESMSHNQFKSAKEIDNIGINNYMISFIEVYDSMLASYLSTHIDLMQDLKQKIEKAQKNWNKYISNEEIIKYNLILDKVHDYMLQIENNITFTETEILYYIGKKLGISEKIAKYEDISDELYNMIMDNIDDDFYEAEFDSNSSNRFYYNSLMKTISSILSSNVNNENKTESSNNKKCKVLKMDFDKNIND